MADQSVTAERHEEACRATWNARLLDYQLARLLYEANAEFGPMAAANREFDDEHRLLAHEYGSVERAKTTPQGAVRADRAFQRTIAAEERNCKQFLEPMWEASRALAREPAPDVAALKIKLEVIKHEEVWNDGSMDEDCFEIVQADAARLSRAA